MSSPATNAPALLNQSFKDALSLIEIKGKPKQYAIDAHTEIRALLETDTTLCSWGVDTVLIGSQKRNTGIYPGKDVDVFTKLTDLAASSTDPQAIYDATRRILEAEYGSRATPQNRSIAISFDREGFKFSVDVVPAVVFGERWAIPKRDTSLWGDPDERWVETDPEYLTSLTIEQNKRLLIDGQGAYVPIVKLVRQTRKHHRGNEKPGGFFFELLSYWAFEDGDAQGATFAEVFASTLVSIADRLANGQPLVDPVLDRAYQPPPEQAEIAASAVVFADLTQKAQRAVSTDDRCEAGALWKEILGQNEQGWCFPIPSGCDEEGRALPVTKVGTSRGSGAAGGFA